MRDMDRLGWRDYGTAFLLAVAIQLVVGLVAAGGYYLFSASWR
jgi:hypothetical protein